MNNIIKVAESVYEQLNKKEIPKLYVPDRTAKNVKLSEEGLTLGSHKFVRSAGKLSTVKPFAQLCWLTWYINKELLSTSRTTTLRDIYYTSMGFEDISFQEQHESNSIIEDLEALTGLTRENFNIYPKERAVIFGDAKFRYVQPRPWIPHTDKIYSLNEHPDGLAIGPELTSNTEFLEVNADKIIVAEKQAVFRRFVEDGVYKKYNALLVFSEGQPPRNCRILIRKLSEQFKLPVFVLTDSVIYDEPIIIKNGKGIISFMKIGEFVDKLCEEQNSDRTILLPNEYFTLGYDFAKQKMVWTPIYYVFRTKKPRKIWNIKTEAGRELNVTDGHSLFIFKDGEIKVISAKDLKVGDFLVIPERLPPICGDKELTIDFLKFLRYTDTKLKFGRCKYWVVDKSGNKIMTLRRFLKQNISNNDYYVQVFDSNTMTLKKIPTKITFTKELCWALGLMLAEGSASERYFGITLSKQEMERALKFKDIIEKTFGVSARLVIKHNSINVSIGNTFLAQCLRHLGFKPGRRTKVIPKIIWNLPGEHQIQFLKGWLEGDGHHDSVQALSCGSASSQLVNQASYLLLSLGVISSILPPKTQTKYPFYTLQIPAKSIQKNCSELYWKPWEPIKHISSHHFSIPHKELLPLFKEINDYYQLGMQSTNKRISRQRLLKLVNKDIEYLTKALEGKLSHEQFPIFSRRLKHMSLSIEEAIDKLKKLKEFLESDLTLVEVKEINIKDYENYVYDLGTATNNFITGFGAVLVHNSDPYGLSIFLTIKYNSISLAHVKGLNAMNAKWIGIYPQDIIDYKLPVDPKKGKFSDKDTKRLYDLMKDIRCKSDPFIMQQLRIWDKLKKKVELEAFSKYGINFISDVYLKNKLKVGA